jgi:hypothetical protein
MGRESNAGLINRLALSRAAGVTVSDWANANGVPVSTAAGWCHSADFQRSVRRYRKELSTAMVARIADELTDRSAAAPSSVPLALSIVPVP